ncbi:MAG: cell surface protein, partial [Clostridia bacterium]
NVPVALYNAVSGKGAVALTDASGAYTFTNVPAGNYSVIECWGTAGAPTPIDFGVAQATMPQPIEKEPPLSSVPAVTPPLADVLCALNPNLQKVVVTASTGATVLFFDAAVGNKPIVFTGVSFVGSNLITAADNGTWGANAPGTPIMTIAPIAPYPGVTPGFVYVNSATPSDGHYSVMNTRTTTTYPWWQLSDHTTMIETGRVLTVNGANPGAIIFKQPVAVLPNTQYALTAWVLNLINQTSGNAAPKLALSVLDGNGNQIFFQDVKPILAQNVPIWYQNGFLFNTLANNNITVEILSEGPAAVGNDYLIDDVELYQIKIEDLLTIKKAATPAVIFDGT